MDIDLLPRNEWILGNPQGSISRPKRRNGKDLQNTFRCEVAKMRKSFGFTRYGGEENARCAAERWIYEKADELGLVKNKIKIVRNGDKECLLVKLTRNKVMVTDLEQLDNVIKNKLYAMKIQNDYYAIASKNGIKYCFHRSVVGLHSNNDKKVVDHKNRCTLDNRKENLRIVEPATNSRNCSTSKNNTSGTTGVYWVRKDKSWMARVKEDGKFIERYFSIKVHGKSAKQKAIDCRKDMMKYPEKYGLKHHNYNGGSESEEAEKLAEEFAKLLNLHSQ